MIAFIKGTVAQIGPAWIVVEQNGLGWQIAYPHPEKVHLKEEVMIYTYLHYTEQEISLYGFASAQEKELFMRLISVKGLGPRTAMNMLGAQGSEAIIQAIETGNVAALKKMPGIGAKTASQIVLDLKGKLVPVAEKSKSRTPAFSSEVQDALAGLKNLGYKGSDLNEIGAYLNTIPGKTTQEYLKLGLMYMGNQQGGK